MAFSIAGSPQNLWTGITNIGDGGSGTTKALGDIFDPGNLFGMSNPPSGAQDTTPADVAIGPPPAFVPDYNPYTQSQLPAYMQEQAAESSGINALKSLSSNPGNSPWASAAMAENQAKTNDAIDKSQAGVAGQAAGANSALAMQGGLSEGAREHNQEAAEKGAATTTQGLQQGAQLGNLGIMAQDQQNKLGELGQLTGAQANQVAGYMTANNADVQNQIQENQAQNQYNLSNYQTQAQATAANNNSNAIQSSQKPSIL